MSDSLDSLDKALDAERETQQRLPPVTDDESIDTVIGTNVFVPGAPPAPPKPKKIPPQPPMAKKAEAAVAKVEIAVEVEVEVELESDALNEIVDMTVPIQRTPELAAQFALAATSLAARTAAEAVTPAPAPVIPSAPITVRNVRNVERTLPVNAQRPSSIAPVAIDLTPTPSRSMPVHASAAATQKLRAMPADPPRRSSGTNTFLVASLGATGLAVVGIVAAFVLTGSFGGDSGKSNASSVARTAEGKGVRTAVIDPPPTAPSKSETKSTGGAAAPEEEDPAGVPVGAMPSVHGASHAAPHGHGGAHASRSSSSSSHDEPAAAAPAAPTAKPTKPEPKTSTSAKSTTASAPAAAPEPAPVAAPAAPRPSTGTIVASNPKLMTIVLDGEHRRLSGGQIVVQCGTHRVRAGMSETQVVNVPCGGTTTL